MTLDIGKLEHIEKTLINKYMHREGDYISSCLICEKTIENVNKYCRICKECAYKKYIIDLENKLKELTNCSNCGKESVRKDPIMVCDSCYNGFTKKELFIWKFREALQNGKTKIVVAVKMNQKNLPEQSIELIINDKNLQFKLDYYDKAYDDNLVLKNCSDISIVSYMFA